jgi:nucleoid DNA-binding protein
LLLRKGKSFLKSDKFSLAEIGKFFRDGMVNLVGIFRFGIFLLKKWVEKIGRNISKDTSVKIPVHFVPALILPKNL